MNPDRNQASARLLRAYAAAADVKGEFQRDHEAYGERFGISRQAIDHTTQRLIKAGALERVSYSRLRVTGRPFDPKKAAPVVRAIVEAPPLAMEDDTPTEPTYRGGAPCSYATARACGIEPRVYLTANRGALNSTSGTHHIAVTLARIPCLERPLPREAA